MRLSFGCSRTGTRASTRTICSPSRSTRGETLGFAFRALELPGIVLVEPRVFGDARGWFMESYKRSEFAANGIDAAFVQDSRARSTTRHSVRGMHYQIPPSAQGKLVSVVEGAIHDVVLDIRKGSPTFGRAIGIDLSAADHRMLWIPEGFAHGYCTLTETTEVHYKLTAEYDAPRERTIRWDDPALGIQWPVTTPLMSDKDKAAPPLSRADLPFTWKA